MTSVARGTSLRAGGACVRCRKGKTKCVYDNGRAPCKNCAKGMHECYLPSESNAHMHGQAPARVARPRESLPGDRNVAATSDRQPAAAGAVIPRNLQANTEKLTPELITECERVINKTLPSCVAFHKPSFLQKLKNGTLEPSIVNGLLTCAARSSTVLIRRFGNQGGGASAASEHFAVKTFNLVMQNLDNPSLADIQALCLLTIHEWGNRNAVRAYVYLGQAARMTQMYRIIIGHQTTGDSDQFIKDESFRRTLWLIYILDCFLTSSPGRHPAVSHHDVKDIPLPCPDMNYNFGTPAYVRTLTGNPPSGLPEGAVITEVGEFGHIVMATQAWRNVIEMLTTVTVETYSEEQCLGLEAGIEAVRNSLPMHFVDKPAHINLHITMGSGFTYAMLHCLLHSATIMVHRRRLLHFIQTEGFKHETWRTVPHVHLNTVDRVFAASHNIVSLLLALETNADKDSVPSFPLVMLFSCFTACATVAWFSLKGLTPIDVNETAEAIVADGMRFLQDGANTWILAVPWYRHLAVMAKVLRNDDRDASRALIEPAPPSIKDDTASQPDNNHESIDYERHSSANPQDHGESNGAEAPRKSGGFTTINGGSAGTSTPATASPPAHPKAESPVPSSAERPPINAPVDAGPADMTGAELCAAFERQLLELDDLAAFMGGGV
ncbi:hypothetical protein EKO27_g10583 [Xylaria grammica]|uniref:Zn(2)-C6 fungal-type domain-containing protein n=1 Tax=Xylaria grammica TaxID=363999 RepID=A0A439CQZ4_9PEZI|nr:hypothetical protein EKO27_g10583 [Xylaria grammica]